MKKLTLFLAVVVYLGAFLPGASAESDFHYRIPDGWVDLKSPTLIADNIPQPVMAEAVSGKYALFAADPQRATRQSVPVSFNVVEAPMRGRVTLGVVRQAAVQMSGQLQALGAQVTIVEMKLAKLDGVDIGVVASLVETPRGNQRMLQYLIPGRTHAAVLTYTCPMADYDHYSPIFESSAMATTGAYGSSFNFGRIWLFGALGAVVAVVITLMNAGKGKTKAPIPVQAAAAPNVWECPNCKRRVPLRVDQCRCGAARPV